MATLVDAWHRYCDQGVLVDFVETRRETVSLIAEDEIVAFLKMAVIDALVSFCAAEEHPLGIVVDAEKLLPILIDCDV